MKQKICYLILINLIKKNFIITFLNRINIDIKSSMVNPYYEIKEQNKSALKTLI